MAVDIERRDAVAVITLNRQEALNAMSPEQLDALEERLREADTDPAVGAIVLTGAGPKAFCAGADIGHMREATPDEARAFARRGHDVADLIEHMDTPVVAAVNGYALGGGCEMALACDVRVCSDNARFSQPEITLGILPGWGGTQRLARATSLGFAKEMILTGRAAKADEALAKGLVNHVYTADELMDKAVELAASIARQPAWAAAAAKRMCNLALGGDKAEALAREVDTFALAFTTPDQREGMAAFLDKRTPNFSRG
ncbi:MAG: enoyl-CoA hydratase/isomerase family protein [Thermoleophilia bacterium]|nr:enoyl-CoA hydratase/isomerase family protein [Thermoleophilia bacterium]